MRKLIAALAVVGSLAAFAPAAHASEVCFSVRVTVNGDDVVNQAGCQQLP